MISENTFLERLPRIESQGGASAESPGTAEKERAPRLSESYPLRPSLPKLRCYQRNGVWLFMCLSFAEWKSDLELRPTCHTICGSHSSSVDSHHRLNKG